MRRQFTARIHKAPLSASQWNRVVKRMELSPREADVLRLVMSGAKDKQIMVSLGISHSTLRTHFRHMFAQHAVHDRTSLVLRAFAALHGDGHRQK